MIRVGFGMQVAETLSYPVVCQFPLFCCIMWSQTPYNRIAQCLGLMHLRNISVLYRWFVCLLNKLLPFLLQLAFFVADCFLFTLSSRGCQHVGWLLVQLATRLPHWLAGGLLRGIMILVYLCVVLFSKFNKPNTHDLLRTSLRASSSDTPNFFLSC